LFSLLSVSTWFTPFVVGPCSRNHWNYRIGTNSSSLRLQNMQHTLTKPLFLPFDENGCNFLF
jgi:hypothetical protein